MREKQRPKQRWYSVLFFTCACVTLLVVVAKAYATEITLGAGTPAVFDFTEKAPDGPAEVVAAVSGQSWDITASNKRQDVNIFPGVNASSVSLTRIGSGGADSIVVDSFTTSPASPSPTDNKGLLTIGVGYTRTALSAGQVAGTYTGAFALSVRYLANTGLGRVDTQTLRIKVLTSITMVKDLNLEFGETYIGEGALVIAADAVVTGAGQTRRQAAKFTVSGSGSHTYNISLPGSITLAHSSGGGIATKEIVVSAFSSSPSGTGTLSAGVPGTQVIYVGATRAAPVAGQISGVYSGAFTVTTSYY